MIGIYSIKNIADGKIYVGLSTKIESRFSYHRRRLRNKKHPNEHLQNAWNRDGEDSFEFGIVEECEESLLNEREQHWIARFDSMNRAKGYNKCAGGGFGRMAPEIRERIREKLRKQTISTEQRKKISETLKGREQDPEVVAKRAKGCRKCDDDTEAKVVDLYQTLSMPKIAEILGMERSTVRSILRRKGESK